MRGKRHLTPVFIVKQLDKYIIGQEEAKKAVAIALRNRWRRQSLPASLRDEVAPKNILMIGPTGVGKTEIARRLAMLAQAPFIKVEASKYTEVGYVGRDVESMVRDLASISVHMVRVEWMKKIKVKAKKMAEERLLDLLLPPPPRGSFSGPEKEETEKKWKRARERMREKLKNKELEDRMVEIKREEKIFPTLEIFSGAGVEQLGMNLEDFFGDLLPRRKREKKVSLREAREILLEEEAGKLIDRERLIEEALKRVENSGIIFIDELDKLIGKEHDTAQISREGVQRDLLPIIEGTTVNTRWGSVKTDHILFIGAGAFHNASPSDLIPELQGRFPLRVELDRLTQEDFEKILLLPKNALTKQYQALLKTEGIELIFEEEAIKEIARLAYLVNERTEDIGARRLHTVMEKVLEDISFQAPRLRKKRIIITPKYVQERLKDIVEDEDLSRYIL